MDDELRQETIKYWRESAEHDFSTAKQMLANGHYDWCLFVGQLSLEKLLKGLIVKTTHDHAPLIHNLKKLAELGGLTLNQDQSDRLVRISQFNLEARYAETKLALYKTANLEFSATWFKTIEDFYLWFISLY